MQLILDLNLIYDKILDLTCFTDSPYKDNNNSYKLFATIHHNGSNSYGHYYSLICIEDQWYEFNDSHVRVMENMSFNSSNVCVDCGKLISYGATRCIECNREYLKNNNPIKNCPTRESDI